MYNMLPIRAVFPIICVICSAAGRVSLKNITDENVQIQTDGNEIHCYCNLAACITSSYMCKTEKNESGCFKRFDHISQQYHYGCLDSLLRQIVCPKDIGNIPVTVSPSDSNHCCHTDMCNHETIVENTLISFNEIYMEEPNEEESKKLLTMKNTAQNLSSRYYTNSEIWKRAFMIAVPICGLMILLILIFIALRILRSDISEDVNSSSKLIKQNYDVAAVSINKLMQSSNLEICGSRSQTKARCFWYPKFPSIFTNYNKSNNNVKNANYRSNLNVNSAPRVSKKFSRQNSNILKLPYKFSELKQKNYTKGINGQANNNSINNKHDCRHSQPVTLEAHFADLRKYHFTQ